MNFQLKYRSYMMCSPDWKASFLAVHWARTDEKAVRQSNPAISSKRREFRLIAVTPAAIAGNVVAASAVGTIAVSVSFLVFVFIRFLFFQFFLFLLVQDRMSVV